MHPRSCLNVDERRPPQQFALSPMAYTMCAVIIIVTVATLTNEETGASHDSIESVIMQQFTLPSYHCPMSLSSGGWWSCSTSCIKNSNCVVVSFATPNDYAFERAVLQQNPSCEVHIVNRMLIWPWGKPNGVRLHSLQLSSVHHVLEDDASFCSPLQPIITGALNHTVGAISILRFDCSLQDPILIVDGLQDLLHHGIKVHQLFIRIHFREAPVQQWGTLLEGLENLSYKIFNRQIAPNVARSQQIIDYSWVLQGTHCATV